ncbi:hypothetical protein [Streptomyces sp. NPDC049555]|uniref:hypothetical protein n=1 Tax=Streptomyces sp. NPDC049555 TaxID=3154930 RepID=UPI0034296C8D
MTTHLHRGAGPRAVLALWAALCGIIGATLLGTTPAYAAPGPAAAADQRHAKGAGDRAAGRLAATLSWTTTYNDPWYVDKLLGDARVDGIIAGYGAFTGVREYDNSRQCANAIKLIRDWVTRHGTTHRMTTGADRLFR